jgi:hypothetical protein
MVYGLHVHIEIRMMKPLAVASGEWGARMERAI